MSKYEPEIPEWYQEMKKEPFGRETFTKEKIRSIERLAAERKFGGKSARLPIGLTAAALLVAIVSASSGGIERVDGWLRQEPVVSPEPAPTSVPTPNASAAPSEGVAGYRLKGEVGAFAQPDAYGGVMPPLFTANPSLDYEVTEREGKFVNITGSGGKSGWIPEWYVVKADEGADETVANVKPMYLMIVGKPTSFRLFPGESVPSGFELEAGKTVRVKQEFQGWVNVDIVTYDSPYAGEKWVEKSALIAWDPAKAKEGKLKTGAVVYDENGRTKAAPPENASVKVEGEENGRFRFIAAGGFIGYADKAAFVPNPFQEDVADHKPGLSWSMTDALMGKYERYAQSKSDAELIGLEPIDLFRFYVRASESDDAETMYALYAKGSEYGTPTLDEMLDSRKRDPEGHERSKQLWIKLRSYRLEQEIDGDSALIRMTPVSGTGAGAEDIQGFMLTRTKAGVWKVNWLPMQ